MRRLPVYFLIDVSESMVGEPIESVQKGMRTIIQELRSDPYALETVYVSVIAFAGKAQTLSPLEEIYKFYPPEFPIGDGTSLGGALEYLMKDLDMSIQKTTREVKGDWKPIIFLFTDGAPTDDPSKAIQKWNTKYRSKCNLVAISLGDTADTYLLGKITESVLRLNETDKETFKSFFKWVTASIKSSSVSVTDYSDDGVKLAPTEGINLEKVDVNKKNKIDENVVVLLGKCSETNHLYLTKFQKQYDFEMAPSSRLRLDESFYKLVGSYPIDEVKYRQFSSDEKSKHSVKSDKLLGAPTCPCCGNQFGIVICNNCDQIFCCGQDGRCKCPWCGSEGILGSGDASFDISRERG